jgi:hypothetical protein
LVSSTTYAAGFNLNAWFGVFNGTGDDLERINRVGSFVGAIDRSVNDALCERAFAVLHDFGDEVTDNWAVVTWIAAIRLGEDSFATWHNLKRLGIGKITSS